MTIGAASHRYYTTKMKSNTLVRCSMIFIVGLSRVCDGLPMFLLTSGRGKCVVVDAAQHTTLRVEYDAPDILDRSHPNHGPTRISIRSKNTKSNIGLKSEDVFEQKGHINFDVPSDGPVEICIRASAANSKNPMRFGLVVKQTATDDDATWNDGVSKQWTQMEEELRLSMRTMRAIQAEADYSKDRDMQFHRQTVDMYAAVMWWPIVHVCVLILTGFTQATHIIRFFKARHIV